MTLAEIRSITGPEKRSRLPRGTDQGHHRSPAPGRDVLEMPRWTWTSATARPDGGQDWTCTGYDACDERAAMHDEDERNERIYGGI